MDKQNKLALKILLERSNYEGVEELVNSIEMKPEERSNLIGKAQVGFWTNVSRAHGGAQNHCKILSSDHFLNYLSTGKYPREVYRIMYEMSGFLDGYETGTLEPVVSFFSNSKTRKMLDLYKDKEIKEYENLPHHNEKVKVWDKIIEAVHRVFRAVGHYPFFAMYERQGVGFHAISRERSDKENLSERITKSFNALSNIWRNVIDRKKVVQDTMKYNQSKWVEKVLGQQYFEVKESLYAVLASLIKLSDKATVSYFVAREWIPNIKAGQVARNVYKNLINDGVVDKGPVIFQKEITVDDVFNKALADYEKEEHCASYGIEEALRKSIITQSHKKTLAHHMLDWFKSKKDDFLRGWVDEDKPPLYCTETAKKIFTEELANAAERNDTKLLNSAINLPSSLLNLDDPRLEGFATVYRMQNQKK